MVTPRRVSESASVPDEHPFAQCEAVKSEGSGGGPIISQVLDGARVSRASSGMKCHRDVCWAQEQLTVVGKRLWLFLWQRNELF